MYDNVNKDLQAYVEQEIIPRYDGFDAAHQRDHAMTVIEQSMALLRYYDLNPDMVYAIAAYHDTGLVTGRELHHVESAKIIRADKTLLRWFTPEEIDIMADAAEDHRASSKHEPRTIYGRIVAEADRVIVPETIIRRTIQYGQSHYPELDKEGQWRRTREHLREKYGDGGYLHLWIPESPNAARLEDLRVIIRDDTALRNIFEKIYESLSSDRYR